MGKLDEDVVESLKVEVKSAVKESMENYLNEGCKDKDYKEEEDVEDDEDSGEDEESGEEDEDDEESDQKNESDEQVDEQMSVTATQSGSNKTVTKNISRHGDLVKMANTGNYEYFTIKKRSGEEKEYHVEKVGGKYKLVEM